jgi:hypothetical protein
LLLSNVPVPVRIAYGGRYSSTVPVQNVNMFYLGIRLRYLFGYLAGSKTLEEKNIFARKFFFTFVDLSCDDLLSVLVHKIQFLGTDRLWFSPVMFVL